jgi:hypothetical protein
MNVRVAGWIPVLAAGVVFLASCDPLHSKNPLSDPKTAVADARLPGVWAGRMGEDAEATLTIVPKEGAEFDVILLGNDAPKGAVVLSFEGFPSTVAGKTYWNLRAKKFIGDYADKTQLSDDYIFIRYDLAKNGTLTLSYMDDDFVKASVKAGTLEGAIAEKSPLTLTASTEKLGGYFGSLSGADDAKVFKSLGTFRKARMDYPKPSRKK